MSDLTRHSDRIMGESRTLRDDNRTGGRHRAGGRHIGKASAQLRWRQTLKLVRNLSVVTLVVLIGAVIAGLMIDGLGFAGIILVAFVLIAAWVAVGAMSRTKPPQLADINKGDVRQMVGRTELWLEAQRPALPAPAALIVEDMGVQLDALGLQLEGLDQNHPKAREVRSLVGEQLPGMIDSYRKIPATMRGETRAGSTPDLQLTESLGKISGEIESITRQLAEGSLDDLAIKHRYLDYKFGEGTATAPQLEHDSTQDPR